MDPAVTDRFQVTEAEAPAAKLIPDPFPLQVSDPEEEVDTTLMLNTPAVSPVLVSVVVSAGKVTVSLTSTSIVLLGPPEKDTLAFGGD